MRTMPTARTARPLAPSLGTRARIKRLAEYALAIAAALLASYLIVQGRW
jgi:hypothetical protein